MQTLLRKGRHEMKTDQLLFRWISLTVAVSVMLGATSCGTLIYPERRGQTAGRIDVGIAVLDGIGLLAFLIPGVIAFAVDFSTGAIYLPPSSSSQLELDPTQLQDSKITKLASKRLTQREIQALVQAHIREDIRLASPETRVAKVLPDQPLVWSSVSEALTPAQLAAFEND